MSVSQCQLSIPLTSIQRLVESQQYKLLICQSKRIEVSEWEISALQDICVKKGWITKGIAIVHKYAGCIDEIQQCFSRLNQSIEQLRESQRINNGDGNALLEEVLTICVVFLRLYYNICQWRKLQWTPRPIVIEEDSSIYSIAEYVAMKLNQFASFLMELSDAHLRVLKKVPVELLTILFSPIQMYEGIAELHNKLTTGGTSLSSTLAANIGHNGPSILQDIAKMVSDIFNMEDLIDEKWKEFHPNRSFQAHGYSSQEETMESTFLATLCIPYPELKNASISMRWFVSSFAAYDRSIKLLRTLIHMLLDSYPRMKASEVLSDGLISLIDEKKSTMRWASYSHRTLSITNQLVLQSLSPVTFRSPIVTGNFFPANDVHENGFMEILVPSADNRNDFQRGFRTQIHALSPVHSVSKDSNASTTFDGPFESQAKMKIPPHLTEKAMIKVTQRTLPHMNRPEDLSDSSREASSSSRVEAANTDRSHTRTVGSTNTGPEVISDDGEEPQDESRPANLHVYSASSSSPTLKPLVTPSSKLSHDNSFNSFMTQSPSMNSPLPAFVKRADSGNRGRGFSADASNHGRLSGYASNNNTSQSWKRKRMLSDPLANLDGKRVSFTRQRSDSSSVSGTRARTWSARGKLMGIDFSTTLLSTALRLIDNEDEAVEDRAARKIAVWYMMVAPRRKLLNRLTSRDCANEIVNLILDKTHQMVQVRVRRRKHLLRQGAAMKIQRAFRYWVANVLEEERKMEREERRRMAQQRLIMVIKAVHNGIRIFRYMKYAIRKRLIKRDANQRHLAKPIYSLAKIIDMYAQLFSLHKRLEMQRHLQERLAVDRNSTSDRRIQTFKAMERSVLLIQRLVRGFIARKRMLQAKAMNDRHRTVTLFVAKCLGIRRRKRQERLDKAARAIQKFMRGYLARRKLFRVVNAGLKLNMLWRKYTAYRSLKGQLRRVEKPHTIVIHGIRNILPKMFVTGSVRVKVLVWWNPLLHIVGHNDYLNFLQSKQPQYIYTSELHKVVSEEVVDTETASKPAEDPSAFTLRNSFSIEALTRLGSRLGFGNASDKSELQGGSANNSPTPSDRKNSNGFGWGSGSGSSHGNDSPNRKKSLGGSFFSGGNWDSNNSPTPSNKSQDSNESSASLPPVNSSNQSQSQTSTNAVVTPGVPLNSFVKRPLPPPSFRAMGTRANMTVLSAVKEVNEGNESKGNSMLSVQSHISEKKPVVSPDNTQKAPPPIALPRLNSKTSIVSPAAMLAAARNSGAKKTRSDTDRPKNLRQVSPLRINQPNEDGENEDEEDEDEEDEEDEEDDDEENEDETEKEKPKDLVPTMSFRSRKSLALSALSAAASTKRESPSASSSSPTLAPTSDSVPVLAPSPSRARLTLRQTLTFALKLGQLAKKEEPPAAPKKIRISANFEDETIKIPGCHGNGVFRFEVYDGDRKVGYSNFFLNQRGELMYWGGEYQESITVTSQKRAVQINAQVLKRNDQERVTEDGPKIDFRVIAGAPLRSRCQWGRVVARGKGPFKRMLQSRDVMSSLAIFDSWHRLFFALDEFGLFLFENKFNYQPFYKIPITDLKSVAIDLGAPIRTGSSSAKNIVEDINNVILKTHAGDELYIRFPDAASRVAWYEVFQNAIDYQSQSHNASGGKRNWFGSTFFDKKASIYSRSIKTTFENSQPMAPSAIAGNRSNSHGPSFSPLKSKYLSHFMSSKKKGDDEDDEDNEDDEDGDEENSGEGKNLKKVLNKSIGMIANSTASLFNSNKPANNSSNGTTSMPPVVPPPPRVNSSPVTITNKSRTPPIFSVPFKDMML